MPFTGFAQAIQRGAELAEEESKAEWKGEWLCVWRSEYLYPRAYHAALQNALPTANLIVPYETYHGLHYCQAAWCQANWEAILRANADELRSHSVVAPVYETRSFPHFAIRADLWRRTGGFDARLSGERAAVVEWVQRVARDTACAAACPFEMIAFRQNINRKIEVRPTPQEMRQAEQELLAALAAPEDAHALLNDTLPPLRPRHPESCYSTFPRPERPVADAKAGGNIGDMLLQHAREQLQALNLTEAADGAEFLTRLNNRNADAYHLLGTALYAQGRRYEAAEKLRRSYILDRGNREQALDALALWRDIYDLACGSVASEELAKQYGDDAEVQAMAQWFAAQKADSENAESGHRFFQPGDTVFDVGAHYGVKAQAMLEQSAGRVVCFDCQPNCVAALQAKFGDAPNVVVMPAGLADKPGNIRFSICSAGEGLSTFSTEWKQGRFAGMNWNQQIIAPVTTLDLMIAQFGRPAYCKIDVEGFEYNVLRGLTQPIPCLSFEFAKEFLAQTRCCVEYLAELGFDGFNVKIGDGERLLFGRAVTPEHLLSTLEQSPDKMLWGDIYAFCGSAYADMAL